MAEDGAYRTDDLALAVILDLAGFQYQLAKLTQTKAVWVFEPSSDEEDKFDDLVGDYTEFRAAVEPRQFTSRWYEMRRELFAFMPPPPRRPVPRLAST